MFSAGLLAQVGSGIAAAFGWRRIGGSTLPLIVGTTVFFAVAFVYDRFVVWPLVRKDAATPPDPLQGPFRSVPRVGLWSAMAWAPFGTALVARVSTRVIQWLCIAALVALFLRELRSAIRAYVGSTWIELAGRRVPPALWWAGALGMVAHPLLFAWIGASGVMPLVHDDRVTVRSWLDSHRRPARRCDPWTAKGAPLRVAVMLSGGGYRAALTHAGVLAALDEQCVPIDLLSTVSGGSIVGAAYALGVPPPEFAARLVRQKPGLPDARLSVLNAFRSNSDVHRRHLAEAYFGGRTLADLPDRPMLLVNTTDMKQTPAFARQLFQKDWPPEMLSHFRTLPKVADAVAASSAFPGPFMPVDVLAETRKEDGLSYGTTYLVDGGVVENLGVEGLRTYLTGMSWVEWSTRRPALLIISDATGYAGSGDRMVINPAADEMLIRASSIQYDALHGHLYGELLGTSFLSDHIGALPGWQQYYSVTYPPRFVPHGLSAKGREEPETAPEPRLATVVIPATATATAWMLTKYPQCVSPRGKSASDVQKRVSSLPTLNELDVDAAQDAFWLGHTLGQIYGQAIECARRALGDEKCKDAPQAPTVDCTSDLRRLLGPLPE